jgi:hypothetical protein
MSQNNAVLLQPNKTQIQRRIIDNLSYGKEEETRIRECMMPFTLTHSVFINKTLLFLTSAAHRPTILCLSNETRSLSDNCPHIL